MWPRSAPSRGGRALLLALALLAPAGARAADADLAQLEGRLESAGAAMRTLSGEFEQKNRMKLFRQELTSRGRLFFEKGDKGAPARLRWEYLAPDRSVLLLTGDQAQLIMPGQAPRRFDTGKDGTLRAIFDQLGLWLGSGSLRDQKAHLVRLLGTKAAPVLVLTPREQTPLSKIFARIELRLDGKSLLLRSLLLVERSGDEKELIFTRLQRDTSLPQGVFKAAAP